MRPAALCYLYYQANWYSRQGGGVYIRHQWRDLLVGRLTGLVLYVCSVCLGSSVFLSALFHSRLNTAA